MGEIRSFCEESSPNRWALKNRYINSGLEINCFATGVSANEMFNRFKKHPHNVKVCLFKLWKVIKFGGNVGVFILNLRI